VSDTLVIRIHRQKVHAWDSTLIDD